VNHSMLEDIFNEYRLMKRAAVDHRDQLDGDTDIPMLVYVGEGPMDDTETQVAVIVIPSGGREDLCNALASTMARMFMPHWAAVLTDGYVIKEDDAPSAIPAGGLRELFEAGTHAVDECLTITACCHGGESYADSVTYWYDDDGDIWFRDNEGMASEMNGPLVEVIKDVTSLWGLTHDEVMREIMRRSPGMN
jgi:hypothetical protein